MGCFSWKTSDTKQAIKIGKQRTVYLYAPDDTVYAEPCYQGYGVFAGRDVYALLANWNAPELCTGSRQHDRDIGISLYYSGQILKYPIKLSYSDKKSYDVLERALDDEAQGF